MNEQAANYIHRHRVQPVVDVNPNEVQPDGDYEVVSIDAHAGTPVVINLGGKSLVISGVDLNDHVSFDISLFDDTPDAGASEETGLAETPPTPVGVFGFVNGHRVTIRDTHVGPQYTNHGWPALTTVVLLADKVEAPRPFQIGDTVYTAPGQNVGDKGVISDVKVATSQGVDYVQATVQYFTGGRCIIPVSRLSHVEDAS